MHTEEVKVRLTQQDKERLQKISNETGTPIAVLARCFIKKAINRTKFSKDILLAQESFGSR